MNRSRRNVDKNQSINTSYVFSLPLSPFENVDTKVATVDRKRKATWEAGGVAKKKRMFWDTQAKKQLFNTKTNDKRKNNCSLKKIKQAKVLNQKAKRIDNRELLSTNGVTDDQVKYSDFPSKSGNTHGKVKVTVSAENDAPTKRVDIMSLNKSDLLNFNESNHCNNKLKKVSAKKINWSVSTIIPFYLKEALTNAIKSVTRFSVSPKVNINNNITPYPATSSIDLVKANWETISFGNKNY